MNKNKNTHVKSKTKVLTVSQKTNYKPSRTQLRERYSKNAFEQGIESLQHNTKTVIASDSMRCNCMEVCECEAVHIQKTAVDFLSTRKG